MEIKELYIENFGKLSKYRKNFSEGLNAFLEENGFGKTTLTVFIKAMLYGFDDTRKLSLDENDRKKYTPWQGGAFGGWLSFSVGEKNYRVERSFSTKASEDTFDLYNLDTGMLSSDFSENLGEELFGIDSDGFERTVFLSEKNITGKNNNQTISAKLSNLVGVEGDIGDFDSAIKLLDNRRRFYQKKGGLGEIYDIQAGIYALEEEITSLKRKKETASKYEEDLSLASNRIATIKSKKEELLTEQRKIILENEKRAYEIQYSEMLGALVSDEKREEELDMFFEKKLPQNYEVAVASESISEAVRLERTLGDLEENNELSSLENFFKNDTDINECERMANLSKRVADNNAKIIVGAPKSEDLPSPFKKVPSAEQIEEMSSRLSEKRIGSVKIGGISIILLGTVFTALGLILGFNVKNALFAITAIGVLLTFIGIIAAISQNRNDSKHAALMTVRSFINEIYGEDRRFDSELSALIDMRAELEKYNSLNEKRQNYILEYEKLVHTTAREEREVREFTELFPADGSLTLEEKTEYILRMRRRYDMLIEADTESNNKRARIREKIKELRSQYNEFISYFPTVTENPINEIRTNLAEHSLLKASLSKRRSDAQKFALSHGITSLHEGYTRARVEDPNIAARLLATDEELIEAERNKSKLESEYSTLIRDIEKIDELEEKMRESIEKADIYKDNFAVITKSMELLAKAKNNMTAKYLGKTREGFERYMSVIDESCGEFNMDTSFVVTKSELGKSRQAEAYSRGTKDLHALALRLSLIDALYENEKPPIILDDPFISFDDAHTERALAVLKKLSQNRQILYFTCSKSRRAK